MQSPISSNCLLLIVSLSACNQFQNVHFFPGNVSILKVKHHINMYRFLYFVKCVTISGQKKHFPNILHKLINANAFCCTFTSYILFFKTFKCPRIFCLCLYDIKRKYKQQNKAAVYKKSPAVRKERDFLKILNLLWKTQLSNWNTQRCSHDITTLLMKSNNDGGQRLQWKENLPQCATRTSILFGVTFSQGKEFTIVCLYQRNAPFKIAFYQPFQKNSSCLSQT